MIASEYGYTYDQFMGLTARQLQAFVEAIQLRNENKYRRQARLFGYDLEMVSKNIEREFDAEDKENINKMIKDAVKDRMKRNLGKVNGK